MQAKYKVVVYAGIDSIPLTLEEALEYAFDCNTEHYIINLQTGEILDSEDFWDEERGVYVA